jgi:hypothetical protein
LHETRQHVGGNSVHSLYTLGSAQFHILQSTTSQTPNMHAKQRYYRLVLTRADERFSQATPAGGGLANVVVFKGDERLGVRGDSRATATAARVDVYERISNIGGVAYPPPSPTTAVVRVMSAIAAGATAAGW